MKQGWEIKKLDEVCKVNYGTRVVQKKDGGSTYPVYGGGGATFKMDKYNREDCLIVARFAMSPQCVRFVQGKFFLNDSGLSIESSLPILSQKFLDKHVVALNDKIYSLGKGAAQKNLDITALKNLDIHFPTSLAEQEKIVAELDCLSGIIEKKKQQLKELDALAQSIFNETFMHMEGSPIKLSQACAVVSGLVNPNEEPYCDYPHIGGANIESHTGQFVNVRLAKEENLISGKYPFDETMILYSKIRPNLNKVALPSFKGVCSADMYPLIPKDGFNKVFLKYIFTQKAFLEYAISHSGRANIPKINREDLLNYEFLTYPIQEQRKFASKIEAIEKQKELIKQSIQETETLFNSRMDYYFN